MAQNEAKHSIDLEVKYQNALQQAKNAEVALKGALSGVGKVNFNLNEKEWNAGLTRIQQSVTAHNNKMAQLNDAAAQKQSRRTIQQNLQLSQQLQDFGIQVAGGQNPLLAAVQQGSQLSFIYGGFGNALKALGKLFTPVNLGILGLVAGVGTLAIGFFKGQQNLEEFNKTMALSGNAAGLTYAKVQQLTDALGETSKFGGGEIREMIVALGGSGAFASTEAIQNASNAALNYAKISGKTAQQVASDYAQIAKAPAEWARSTGIAIGAVTSAQYEYIRSLELQGKKQEAASEAIRLFNENFKNASEDLSDLEPILSRLTKGFSDFWNAVANIGAKDPLKEIRALREQAAALENGGFFVDPLSGSGDSPEQLRAKADRIQAIVDAQAKRAAESQSKIAAAKSEQDAKDLARKLLGVNTEYAASQRSLSLAAEEALLTKQMAATKKDMAATEDDMQKAILQGVLNDYERLKLNIDLRKVLQDIAHVYDGVDPNDPSANIAAASKRNKLLEQEIALRAKIDSAPTSKDPVRELGGKYAADDKKLIEERNKNAFQLAEKLNDDMRRMDASRIKDVSDRARAELEIESAAHLKTIELAQIESDERKKAYEAYVEWRKKKEAEITEAEMKRKDASSGVADAIEAYYRKIEERGKIAGESVTRVLGTMEDELTNLFTGKGFDIKGLLQQIQGEIIRTQVVQPMMGALLKDFDLGGIFGDLFGSKNFLDKKDMKANTVYLNANTVYGSSGAGGSGGGIGGIGSLFTDIGSEFGSWIGSLFGFDGGGYTGAGARAGGMDGKGGFLAMVHPNETVVDHTKGQTMGGMVLNISIDGTTDRAYTERLVAQGVQMGLATYHGQVQRGNV